MWCKNLEPFNSNIVPKGSLKSLPMFTWSFLLKNIKDENYYRVLIDYGSNNGSDYKNITSSLRD